MKKLVVLFCVLLSSCISKEPKEGQRRIYNILFKVEPNNPFMEGDTVQIISVKHGYVEYYRPTYYGMPAGRVNQRSICSSSIERFNSNTRLIDK